MSRFKRKQKHAEGYLYGLAHVRARVNPLATQQTGETQRFSSARRPPIRTTAIRISSRASVSPASCHVS
jgi:hypothetical protein